MALFQNNMSHTTFIYKLFYFIQLCDITKCQCTIRMDPVGFFSSRVCIVMIPLWRDWGQLPNSKTVWSHQYAMYFTWYVSFMDGFWGPFSGRARTIIIALTDTINQINLSKPWGFKYPESFRLMFFLHCRQLSLKFATAMRNSVRSLPGKLVEV